MNIIIPTAGHATLLSRTLQSLSECELPASLKSIIIIENGTKYKAEAVVKSFEGIMPVSYRYTDVANKSLALNIVLDGIEDGLILFFDDDVRFAPITIMAYHSACQHSLGQGKYFWGGPLAIDYEQPPPEWLMEFFPRSVKGWSLARPDIDEPDWFLGANWAARAEDLRAVGGFDRNFGPGASTGARGQESNMQLRLKEYGLIPKYIPDALVYHYVPKDRCSTEWLLSRRVQEGKAEGLILMPGNKLAQIKMFFYLVSCLIYSYVIFAFNRITMKEIETFRRCLVIANCKGLLAAFVARR